MELSDHDLRKNAVLKALPREELRRLLPFMDKVDLGLREFLFRQGEAIEHLYFPTSAVVSLLLPTSDGETVELATIGSEGFTGITAILHPSRARECGALAHVVSLIPGQAIQVRADAFEAAMDKSLELTRCIRRYISVLLGELALSVSCNRLHSLEQRCARWLLTCIDKGRAVEVRVTQEMLASILGVYRQSVIQVLNALEAKRVIQCRRGTIKVQSRQRLASLVCECYAVGKHRLEKFLEP